VRRLFTGERHKPNGPRELNAAKKPEDLDEYGDSGCIVVRAWRAWHGVVVSAKHEDLGPWSKAVALHHEVRCWMAVDVVGLQGDIVARLGEFAREVRDGRVERRRSPEVPRSDESSERLDVGA